MTDILRNSIRAGNDSNEIDDHLKIFGKHAVHVDYTLFGYCNLCNTRIDEFGFVRVMEVLPIKYSYDKSFELNLWISVF